MKKKIGKFKIFKRTNQIIVIFLLIFVFFIVSSQFGASQDISRGTLEAGAAKEGAVKWKIHFDHPTQFELSLINDIEIKSNSAEIFCNQEDINSNLWLCSGDEDWVFSKDGKDYNNVVTMIIDTEKKWVDIQFNIIRGGGGLEMKRSWFLGKSLPHSAEGIAVIDPKSTFHSAELGLGTAVQNSCPFIVNWRAERV